MGATCVEHGTSRQLLIGCADVLTAVLLVLGMLGMWNVDILNKWHSLIGIRVWLSEDSLVKHFFEQGNVLQAHIDQPQRVDGGTWCII